MEVILKTLHYFSILFAGGVTVQNFVKQLLVDFKLVALSRGVEVVKVGENGFTRGCTCSQRLGGTENEKIKIK